MNIGDPEVPVPSPAIRVWTLHFPQGGRARVVQLESPEAAETILRALDLPRPRGLLLLHGGAAGLPEATRDRLRDLFFHGLAPLVAREGLAVLDGGTQAGVMQLMGEAMAAVRGHAPLIGVCPAAQVTWPQGPQDARRVPLEPHHTHFVLTPGQNWGEETFYLFALAQALNRTIPSLALLVDGGPVSLEEVRYNVRQVRPLLVVRGSGRLADALWQARQGRAPSGLPSEVVRYDRLFFIDLEQGPQALAEIVRRLLFSTQTTGGNP